MATGETDKKLSCGKQGMVAMNKEMNTPFGIFYPKNLDPLASELSISEQVNHGLFGMVGSGAGCALWDFYHLPIRGQYSTPPSRCPMHAGEHHHQPWGTGPPS